MEQWWPTGGGGQERRERQARCARTTSDIRSLPPIPSHCGDLSLPADVCHSRPGVPLPPQTTRIAAK
eukprot:3489204-Pyramimonas_sp.AAC.1